MTHIFRNNAMNILLFILRHPDPPDRLRGADLNIIWGVASLTDSFLSTLGLYNLAVFGLNCTILDKSL